MNSEATNRRTTLAPTPEVAMRLALPFVFMLFLGTPVLALKANDLRNNLVKIPRLSAVAASKYFVDGLALGDQVKSGNLAHQEYQCRPSDKFSGLIWCHEEHTTPDNKVHAFSFDFTVSRRNSILRQLILPARLFRPKQYSKRNRPDVIRIWPAGTYHPNVRARGASERSYGNMGSNPA